MYALNVNSLYFIISLAVFQNSEHFSLPKPIFPSFHIKLK